MKKTLATLVEALHNPACYDHPADRVKLIETHISWVFLAGNYAYKLKKPVNFGFLDFSTLRKRRHFCQEELRLNRRFAPQLYLDLVSIGGSAEKPVFGGSPTIDYMVKMKRFSRQDELDLMLTQGRLTAEQIEQFADYLAHSHKLAPQLDRQTEFGSPNAINTPVQDNFLQLRPLLPEPAKQNQLSELESWSQATFDKLRNLMQQRKQQGFIRECHGDVHLANMLWHDEQPLLFDCIEFNDNFRCIDVVSDYAFLLMDLDDRGAASFGWRFLNSYLRKTGDYQGLPLLNYYKSYRAMVRAKVNYLRLSQAGLQAAERKIDSKLAQSYLDLASRYSRPRKTPLIICHGFSGAGKSTFINRLAPLYGAVSLHSDIERKRLHGLDATETSQSGVARGIYSEQASRKTYLRLQESAEIILESGLPVIVDATFLRQRQRDQMQQLAARLNVPFRILDFPLSEKELYNRVERRSKQPGQVSEATAAVLHKQMEQSQPLTPGEKRNVLKVHPDSLPEVIAAQLDK